MRIVSGTSSGLPPGRRARAGRAQTVMASLAVLGSALATACGSSEPAARDAAATSMLARGAEVYQASCSSCHGADLRGTDKGPSQLSVLYEPGHHSDASFRSAIARGAPQHHWPFGNMPPVPGLSDDDVDAVIAFVRAEQQRQGFER